MSAVRKRDAFALTAPSNAAAYRERMAPASHRDIPDMSTADLMQIMADGDQWADAIVWAGYMLTALAARVPADQPVAAFADEVDALRSPFAPGGSPVSELLRIQAAFLHDWTEARPALLFLAQTSDLETLLAPEPPRQYRPDAAWRQRYRDVA